MPAWPGRLEPNVNYRLVGQVVSEMVETIGTLEDLTFLAEKAGIGKFDLNKILVDYVDDVQLVAEFARHRGDILKRFRTILTSVHNYDQKAEIHIVAHSEGTVVALLGMLEAAWTDPVPDWIRQVRGFMTFGSPIDKHFVLWPALFCAGYSAFLEDDILLPKFATRLKQRPADALSQFIGNQLSADTQILLAQYSGGDSSPLQQGLAEDLNCLIQAGPLDPELFRGATLSQRTRDFSAGKTARARHSTAEQDVVAGFLSG